MSFTEIFENIYSEILSSLLIIFSRFGFLTGIEFLMKYTLADFNYYLAFEEAVFNNHFKIVQYFFELGITEINVINASLALACSKGNIKIVKYLIEKGADINYENCIGFRFAAENGHLNIVELLYEEGINIRVADDYALRHSMYRKKFDVFKFLMLNCNVPVSIEHVRFLAENNETDIAKFVSDYISSEEYENMSEYLKKKINI